MTIICSTSVLHYSKCEFFNLRTLGHYEIEELRVQIEIYLYKMI